MNINFEEMNPYQLFSKEYWEREYERIKTSHAPKIELTTWERLLLKYSNKHRSEAENIE